jgi:hypothetical protein
MTTRIPHYLGSFDIRVILFVKNVVTFSPLPKKINWKKTENILKYSEIFHSSKTWKNFKINRLFDKNVLKLPLYKAGRMATKQVSKY